MSNFEIILDNSRQNLKEVPPRILEMCNLKMLYLQQNLIKKLPNDFFLSLPLLNWLDLRHNQLKTLPESIAHHQHLENLLLSNNEIEVLPNELGLVPNLKVLQISNNPLTYPSAKVIAAGTKLVCLFLKSQYEKEFAVNSEELSRENVEICRPREKLHKMDVRVVNDQTESGEPVNASLIVKGLSKGTDDDKIVHKICKDKTSSKILIRSYFDDVENYANDHKIILKNTLKQDWIDKLRTLLEEQERILQQERNLQALSSWRLQKKTEPVRNVPREETLPPYGTYPEYDSILTREELLKQIDRVIQHKSTQPKQKNIEVLINDLISQLKDIETTYSTVKSPRSELESAGNEIMKIMDIHKKLLQLQKLNNKL